MNYFLWWGRLFARLVDLIVNGPCLTKIAVTSVVCLVNIALLLFWYWLLR